MSRPSISLPYEAIGLLLFCVILTGCENDGRTAQDTVYRTVDNASERRIAIVGSEKEQDLHLTLDGRYMGTAQLSHGYLTIPTYARSVCAYDETWQLAACSKVALENVFQLTMREVLEDAEARIFPQQQFISRIGKFGFDFSPPDSVSTFPASSACLARYKVATVTKSIPVIFPDMRSSKYLECLQTEKSDEISLNFNIRDEDEYYIPSPHVFLEVMVINHSGYYKYKVVLPLGVYRVQGRIDQFDSDLHENMKISLRHLQENFTLDTWLQADGRFTFESYLPEGYIEIYDGEAKKASNSYHAYYGRLKLDDFLFLSKVSKKRESVDHYQKQRYFDN